MTKKLNDFSRLIHGFLYVMIKPAFLKIVITHNITIGLIFILEIFGVCNALFSDRLGGIHQGILSCVQLKPDYLINGG
jgi:hypothetical protein